MSDPEFGRPVEMFDALLAEGEAATRTSETLRASIRASIQSILDAQTDDILLKAPAAGLKQSLPKGTRLGSLGQTRLRTVHDLVTASVAEIGAVPGIGPQSAQAIFDAANAQRTRIRAGERVRLDPQSKASRETGLLESLTALRRVEREVQGLPAEMTALRTLVDPWRAAASRSTNWISRVFTSKTKKDESRRAVYQLNAVAKSPPTQTVRDHIARVAAARQSAGSPWAEYERDAAALNALLSQFTSLGSVDVDASHGFIGEQIASETQQVTLDRTHLRSYLRAYQAFGAQYILSRRKVILGDEMGLGKTIQALAVAGHLAAKGDKHFLVVCPASVLINWSNETRKHTTLRPIELHGAMRDSATREWVQRGGVAITTFTTLQRLDIAVTPALVVIDEAHYIKNKAAQRSIASRTLIESSRRAVLLSGTPMENRVEEFRNLVEYVQPATARSISPSDGLGGADMFRKAVAPAYLRRNQVDVLKELPDLIEVEDWVQPTTDDSSRYKSAVASRNFMSMRQAAYPVAGQAKSAKMERLLEIVDEAEDNGVKIIVFSFFKNVLDAVRREVPGTAFGPLTGATSPTLRQQMVEAFTSHKGRAVLISQIEAGGVGLNIQAASVVILTEPQWKPSTEVQAIARAHRMGQIRTVQVHRLLAKDTVDERMREVLERKTQLFDEYARRSQAKESDHASVDDGWDQGIAPAENSIIDMERRRLGLA